MTAPGPPPSRIARLVVVVWAVLAALWAGLNIWELVAGFYIAPRSGGLGAVSAGISEAVVELAAAGLLLALALAFARRARASALERRLRRAHFYVTLAYVADAVVAIAGLTTSAGQNQAMAITSIALFALISATLIPVQLFFFAAAVTLAADRYFARAR